LKKKNKKKNLEWGEKSEGPWKNTKGLMGKFWGKKA